jgi:uncharacterized membrane protein
MQIQKMKAARGWIWVKQGYQLIMLSPMLSIITALIAAVCIFMALMVPQIGPPLAILLMPVLIAGYMRVCRALEEHEEVELAQLFSAFNKNPMRLAALGGLLTGGLLIASMVMMAVGGTALATLMESVKSANDPQLLMEAMWTAGSGVSLSLLLGFVLTFALMLAFQYAPMLVFFSDLSPFSAMRASLVGTFRNIGAYTVYSLIMQVVALVLSILPFNLGLIFLLPLGFTSLYVSYRNIFPFADEIAANEPVAPTQEV